MTTFYCRWNGTALEPVSDADFNALSSLPWNKSLKMEARVPRDLGRHRWFFVFVDTVHKALPEHVQIDRETLRKLLTIKAGFYSEFTDRQGNTHQFADSIAFSKMDESRFKELQQAVIAYVCSVLIPGMDSEALENEVYEVLG